MFGAEDASVEAETAELVPAGLASSWFSADELAAALRRVLRGGGGGGGGGECWSARALGSAAGAALAAAAAPLAGDVTARGAELAADGAADGAARLRLRTLRPSAAGAPPPLWFDARALAALRMPFLTPAHVRAGWCPEYECPSCGARFERPNPLKLHLFLRCQPFRRHAFWAVALPRLGLGAPAAGLAAPAAGLAAAAGGGRAHACVYCGKLYSRRYGLKIHIRTHTGYKPLRCRHCARAFGDPSNLNKHVRLHAAAGAGAGAAALACALCGVRVARRRDLERHVRARHAAPAAASPAAAAPAAL